MNSKTSELNRGRESAELSQQTAYTVLSVIRYLLWGFLIFIALAVVGLNADPVILHYFWNSVSLPLYFVVLVSVITGWVIGVGMNLISYMRLKAQHRRLQQRCYDVEREVTRLRREFYPDR